MVKACAKFGARRASVRDRRQKEVMVRKRDNFTKERNKKKGKGVMSGLGNISEIFF